MRIFFAGTPEIAVPSLEILARKHDVAGCLTNPDRRGGRGGNVLSPPVKTAAEGLGIPVFQPEKLDGDFIGTVASLSPELLVVVAYGRIFKRDFMSVFPLGGINLHPSLLPRYRGCSPIQAAILAGDRETGITIQRLAEAMDAGEILRREIIPLDEDETGGSLSEKAGRIGAGLLAEVIMDFEAGRIEGIPQDEESVSFCYRIGKEDGMIDFSEPAVHIERKVRAYHPWPGAWTTWKSRRLLITGSSVFMEDRVDNCITAAAGTVLGVDKGCGFLVQTGDGVLAVHEVQMQAKKVMDWKSFLNGNRDFPGSVLGSDT